MKKQITKFNTIFRTTRFRVVFSIVVILSMIIGTIALADIPGRRSPAGTTVPLPGTQQQELTNITFPAPFNVTEFPPTCGACHGGTIDQQAGHYGNWAGSVMATTARNPVFRADWVVTNEKVKAATGLDGAGNVCARCHMPNAFLSGRIDPAMGGKGDGSQLIHQTTLSTDDEGIDCEFCHRGIGNIVKDRIGGAPSNDPAFNMLSGIADWPHTGDPFPTIKGTYPEAPTGPHAGAPLGMATYQLDDAMTYFGKYGGTVQVYFSDIPLNGTNYTGQTYGIYPPGYMGPKSPVPVGMPQFNSLGQEIVYSPDGSIPIHFEVPLGPPADLNLHSMSPEHSTVDSTFLKSPEFCGTCHDRTLSPVNLAMPRAKEYSEYKLSVYGDPANPKYQTCQTCHMPTMKHEYGDTTPASLNVDPTIAGWWPYAKDRAPNGGTSFHKFGGANYNLAQMAKILYPEVDMEIIGASTGRDNRIFPGLYSGRDISWDRNIRNDFITMRDAASIQITQAPMQVGADANGNTIWEMKVKVMDNTAHRFPTGLPDGRRAWISLVVKDSLGNKVYESGYYDPNEAALYNDSGKQYDATYFARTKTRFIYAQTPTIDATLPGGNAVMVYERRTGHQLGDGTFEMSYDLTNPYIIFDNRIPWEGFNYVAADNAGIKFRKFDMATFAPSEDATRYADLQNWDEVTYRFTTPATATGLNARAELYAQTHTRDFLDFLKAETDLLPYKGPRPEGPPNILIPNYPLTPTYLSDQIIRHWNQQPGQDITDISQISDLNGVALQDNWAGVAYAAWLLSGKSSPFLTGADDTMALAPPEAPLTVDASLITDPTTGLLDPFSLNIGWAPVNGADGYLLWIRYGTSDLTADWDRLAIVYPPQGAARIEFLNDGLNVGKTYAYKVQAFNGKGMSNASLVVTATTPQDIPLPPESPAIANVTDTTATLTWYDIADNEIGFIIERQDVPLDRVTPLPNFAVVATVPSQTPGGEFGTNSWTDAGLQPGRTYNYQVSAYNASGPSVPTVPVVSATTLGNPPAPSALTATVFSSQRIDLMWVDNSGSELGFRIERAPNVGGIPGVWAPIGTVGPNVMAYSNTTVAPGITYHYRVFAYNISGDSPSSNVVMIATPAGLPPAVPTNFKATPSIPGVTPISVRLTWRDNAKNETGFIIERALDPGFTLSIASFSVGQNVAAYTDTSVAGITTYYYRIHAINSSGSSPYSNTVIVVTSGGLPQEPSGLAVTSATNKSVKLTWLDNSTNESGFYIERSTDGVGFKRVGTTGMNVNTFTDKVSSKTTYWYRVQAYNADGVSGYSDAVQITTP